MRTSTLYVGTRCAGVRKIYIGDKAAEKRIREIYIRELGVLMKSWRGKVEGEIVLLTNMKDISAGDWGDWRGKRGSEER